MCILMHCFRGESDMQARRSRQKVAIQFKKAREPHYVDGMEYLLCLVVFTENALCVTGNLRHKSGTVE